MERGYSHEDKKELKKQCPLIEFVDHYRNVYRDNSWVGGFLWIIRLFLAKR